MTFREMRFPIVWITLACVVLFCSVQAGPVSRRDVLEVDEEPTVVVLKRAPPSDFMRGPRQVGYAVYEEFDEGDSDGQAYGQNEADDDDDEDGRRSLRRSVRDIAQRPVADVEEESVIPAETPAPVVDKRPSVLELLSTALDKAIEATSKIPTQQVASDAAGVFHILGQVFSEAIDKVIGGDDGPEEGAEAGETAEVVTETENAVDEKGPEDPPAPSPDAEPMKPEAQEEPSQSDKEIVNNL